MRRALGVLALLLATALPAGAEPLVNALGQGWYAFWSEPVSLPTPEGAWEIKVLICLDDIPGGIAGPPVVTVKPTEDSSSHGRSHLTLSNVGFFPVGAMPYVTVVLQSSVPGTWRLKTTVQGRE